MDKVKFEQKENVGILTLSNPPLNLIEFSMFDKVNEILAMLEESNGLQKKIPGMDIRALMIVAEGDNFTAGVDVKNMFLGRNSNDAKEMIPSFVRMISRLESLPFPTIAAVQGLCLTAGLEIALACDMIWAGESAQFSQAEAVVGLVPLAGGAQRLCDRVGPSRAREIVMTGSFYPAKKFEEWNIVNRVVPDSELFEKTLKFVEKLANGPTLSYSALKEIIRITLEQGVCEADNRLAKIASPLFDSDDVKNGVKSLLEKGPGYAQFEGR
ncbi:MAG: enoyl-CoA hydratase/isomerase family protein [Desulfobacteraceae bacterium]|nr:enoyl-CoA hydratase/isomerase family protein [Desulfobacteraceae bacterium]